MALIWLYLQIIGKPTEKFQFEVNFWTFDRNDFKNASATLMLNDVDERDETVITMKKLISKHFDNDIEFIKWTKDTFEQVKCYL